MQRRELHLLRFEPVETSPRILACVRQIDGALLSGVSKAHLCDSLAPLEHAFRNLNDLISVDSEQEPGKRFEDLIGFFGERVTYAAGRINVMETYRDALVQFLAVYLTKEIHAIQRLPAGYNLNASLSRLYSAITSANVNPRDQAYFEDRENEPSLTGESEITTTEPPSRGRVILDHPDQIRREDLDCWLLSNGELPVSTAPPQSPDSVITDYPEFHPENLDDGTSSNRALRVSVAGPPSPGSLVLPDLTNPDNLDDRRSSTGELRFSTSAPLSPGPVIADHADQARPENSADGPRSDKDFRVPDRGWPPSSIGGFIVDNPDPVRWEDLPQGPSSVNGLRFTEPVKRTTEKRPQKPVPSLDDCLRDLIDLIQDRCDIAEIQEMLENAISRLSYDKVIDDSNADLHFLFRRFNTKLTALCSQIGIQHAHIAPLSAVLATHGAMLVSPDAAFPLGFEPEVLLDELIQSVHSATDPNTMEYLVLCEVPSGREAFLEPMEDQAQRLATQVERMSLKEYRRFRAAEVRDLGEVPATISSKVTFCVRKLHSMKTLSHNLILVQ